MPSSLLLTSWLLNDVCSLRSPAVPSAHSSAAGVSPKGNATWLGTAVASAASALAHASGISGKATAKQATDAAAQDAAAKAKGAWAAAWAAFAGASPGVVVGLEAFDLSRDPMELTNVAADGSRAADLAALACLWAAEPGLGAVATEAELRVRGLLRALRLEGFATARACEGLEIMKIN